MRVVSKEEAKSRLINGIMPAEEIVYLFPMSIFPRSLLCSLDEFWTFGAVVEIMRILEVMLAERVEALNSDQREKTKQYQLVDREIGGQRLDEKLALYILYHYDVYIKSYKSHALTTAPYPLDPEKNPIAAEISLVMPGNFHINVSFYTALYSELTLRKRPLIELSAIIRTLRNESFKDESLWPYMALKERRLDDKRVFYSYPPERSEVITLARFIGQAASIYTGLDDQLRENVSRDFVHSKPMTKENADASFRWLHGEIESFMETYGLAAPGSDFRADLDHLGDPLWQPQTVWFKQLREWVNAYSNMYARAMTERLALSDLWPQEQAA